MARNPTDTAVLPMGYAWGIRVYRDSKTRITLRFIRATLANKGNFKQEVY